MHDVIILTRHLPIKFITSNSSWDKLAWHVYILLLYGMCVLLLWVPGFTTTRITFPDCIASWELDPLLSRSGCRNH